MGRNIRNKARGGSHNTNKKRRTERNRAPKPAFASAEMASLTLEPLVRGEEESKNSSPVGDAAVGGTELSALLQGKGQLEVTEGPAAGNLTAGSEQDTGKRGRDQDGPEKNALTAEGQVAKKLKRAALNNEGVRSIVWEENGFLMAETESKLRAKVREEFKMVREELRAALGISEPNVTLKGALAEIYGKTAHTLIEEALQKVKSTSPLSTLSSAEVAHRSDWADIGRLSVIEGTLNSLEVLCKTRADSDLL
jgi:hypothetical protein